MKSFLKKHKILTTIALVILFIALLGTSYVFSKLGKVSYHDGTVAEEILIDENTKNVAEDMVNTEVSEETEIMDEIETELISEEEVEAELISDEEAASLEETEIIFSEIDFMSDKDVLNILLLGTDERTADFSTNARADSIMILSFNKREKNIKLVSLQRGMGVPVLEGQYAGEYDWITHMFRYGGADLMLKTVREMFGIDVEYYVRVNFKTFEQLIDSVGGVDIELTAAEAAGLNGEVRTNARTKNKVYEGINHLDGYDALQYSRLRYIDSDWSRIQRQRNVIQSVVSSTEDMSLLELNSMLDTVLPLIQTNLTTKDILGLVGYVPAVLGQEFEQMSIPAKGTYGSMKGMGGRTLYAVDFQKNSELLQEFLYGDEMSE